MKIFMLTEGGKEIGFGHITRCISLAQAFEEKGITPELVIKGDSSLIGILKNRNYRMLDWLKEEEKVFGMIADAEIIIIDSYLADKPFYEKVSGLTATAVYFDDDMRLDYPKGIVVNGSIYAEEMGYPKRGYVTHLLGIKYFPLRKEFWQVKEKEIRKNIKSVMVTFGGDDARGMTKNVLRLLAGTWPNLVKKVIIGKGFKDIQEIERLKDANTELVYFPDAGTMKEIMLESDVAISAGGQTLYELARIGVPTIAIAIAGNQLNNVNGWQKAGFVEYAGWWEEDGISENVGRLLGEFVDAAQRAERSRTGRSIIDGNGSRSLGVFLTGRVAMKEDTFK